MLWATDVDATLRKILTLPAPMTKAAISSIGSFLAKKAPEDEALLAKLLTAMQAGWSSVAGRTDA
jgi:hypothetical protein